MAARARLSAALLLLVGMSAVGCQTLPFVTASRPAPSRPPQQEGTLTEPEQVLLVLDGTLAGPSSLGDGKRVVADDPTGAEEAEALTPFRILQESSPVPSPVPTPVPTPGISLYANELPIQNAVVTIKGYDWRIIPQLVAKRSDEDGKFYFRSVPTRVSFFMDVTFSKGGNDYRMLGLTRSGELGDKTAIKVDLASTLVARTLLRIWQMSGYSAEFKDLSPRDYNPLLLNLREALKNGLPSGMPSAESILRGVKQPSGTWACLNDTDDQALVALDWLAKNNRVIDKDIDRLFTAVNYSMTKDSRFMLVRRPPALWPASEACKTPSPTPSP